MEKNLHHFKKLLFISVFICSSFSLSAQNFGNAVKLNGSGNYITVPNVSSLLEPAAFTFECWSKRSTSVSQFGKDRICMSINSGGWGVYIEGNVVKLTNVGVSDISSAGMISDTLWHHIAVTHDGTTAKFYIDGVFDSQQSYAVTFASTGNYTIGSRGNNEFYGGTLDDIRIWSKVKTAAEIGAEYCMELVGNETGLISYYKMNEGAGMVIGDASPSANAAAITNGNNLWVTSSVTCGMSINDVTAENSMFSIFPNPASNFITIQLTERIAANSFTLQLFDLMGREVYSSNKLNSNKSCQIETSSFTKGVYFAKLTVDGNSHQSKFVIE
jgi:hypothetical protein